MNALRCCASLLAALCAVEASAGSPYLSFDLTVEVQVGPAAGETGSGTFAYDPADIVFDPDFGESAPALVSLDFLGQTFTEVDDTDFDQFPVVLFDVGEIVGLDFLVINGDGQGQEILDPRLSQFSLVDLSPDAAGGFFGFVSTELIPEPGALGLLLIGCAFAAPRR